MKFPIHGRNFWPSVSARKTSARFAQRNNWSTAPQPHCIYIYRLPRFTRHLYTTQRNRPWPTRPYTLYVRPPSNPPSLPTRRTVPVTIPLPFAAPKGPSVRPRVIDTACFIIIYQLACLSRPPPPPSGITVAKKFSRHLSIIRNSVFALEKPALRRARASFAYSDGY